MTHPDIELLVRSSDFFNELPEEQLALLLSGAKDNTYAPGQVLVEAQEELGGFFLLISGRVKMTRMSEEGKEQTIYVFGPGEPFCLCGLFDGGACPASAVALEKSRVVMFPAADFDRIVREDPTLLFNMLLVMSRRLKSAMDMIESLSLKKAPERLAVYLLHAERAPDGGKDVVRLPMSHRELAKMIGATPEALSRAFKQLNQKGLVEVRGRDIHILDRVGLAAI